MALAEEFKAQLEPRLGAGVLDGLRCYLEEFDGKRAEASNALGTLKLATREQEEAVAHAIALLSVGRRALVRAGANVTQRQAFGITKKYDAKVVGSVVAALDSFLVGAGKYPELTRAAGMLSSDLDEMKALRDGLIAADQSQEAKKSARKEPVLQRNAAQKRIERAIDDIVNAGLLAFVKDPATSRRFAELVPSARRPAPKRPPPAS